MSLDERLQIRQGADLRRDHIVDFEHIGCKVVSHLVVVFKCRSDFHVGVNLMAPLHELAMVSTGCYFNSTGTFASASPNSLTFSASIPTPRYPGICSNVRARAIPLCGMFGKYWVRRTSVLGSAK